MAQITINDFAKKAYPKFRSAGLTLAGTAGLMGNLYSESAGFIANRVEFLCMKRLKEFDVKDADGKDYTDTTYTAAVDSGRISLDEFLHPLLNSPKANSTQKGYRYGYGAAQFTTESRKTGLYNRTVAVGKSIADEDAQIDYIIYELNNLFPGVMGVLKTTTSVREASDKVLKDFESPNNWQSLSATRADYAWQYYNYFSKQQEVTTVSKTGETNAINTMIKVAQGEIGYLEKASNAYLDDKTKNAGSNNYTKYWRDVYPSFQQQPWCAIWVSWVMMKTFGLEQAKKLLKHWPFTYCPTLASMTSNKTPKVGSVILFYRNGTYAHTGIVIDVTNTSITTIEGNTSGASGIIANGGGVCQKSYALSSLSSNTKYFMPDYSLVANQFEVKEDKPVADTKKTTTTSSTSNKVKWTGYIKRDKSIVRKAAGASKKQIAVLNKGDKVGVCGTTKSAAGNTWYLVKYGGNKYGYIFGKRVSKTYVAPPKTIPGKAAENAIKIANDNSHGYNNSYSGRGGNPDYACSSFVTDCFIKAGVNFGVTCDKVFTSDMKKIFTAHGFTDVSGKVNLKNGINMKVGDVVVKPGSHVEIFVGNGKLAGARGNAPAMKPENGKQGDQTGGEIAVSGYYYFGQTICLRYTADEKKTTVTTTTTPLLVKPTKPQYRVQLGVFGLIDNAIQLTNKAKVAGFDAMYFRDGGKYIVQAGVFTNKENADKLASRIRAAGFDVVVIVFNMK